MPPKTPSPTASVTVPFTITPTFTIYNTTTYADPVVGFIDKLLNKIPLPRWAIYAIAAVVGLLMLVCVVCICVKCCCKKKKNKKDQQVNLKDLNGSSNTALVQPGGEDADYGSAKEQRGRLLYSLEYNTPTSELTVGIKEARELKAMDLGGTSDPYVKIYISPNKSKTYETKVFRKTLNPIFNESFTFKIPMAELKQSTAVMQVFDFNRFTKHDIIGEIRLLLSTVDWNHVIEEWRDLVQPSNFDDENLGEICLSLRYVPTSKKLTVVILEARNLKPMDPGGSSDPYVKLTLALDKKKWKKKKTSIKKCTLNPYFNETFSFEVSFKQIKRVNLVIAVWDWDKLTRNDAIGKINLGCDATGNQLRHWADMLANPRRPMAQWHNLFSAHQVDSTLSLKRRIPFTDKSF